MLLRGSFLKLVKEQVDTFLHLQQHCHRLPSHVHLCISGKLQDGIKVSIITPTHTHKFSNLLCITISLDVVVENVIGFAMQAVTLMSEEVSAN